MPPLPSTIPSTGPINDQLPVVVENPTDVDVRWQYGKQVYMIPAHATMYVPYFAMVLYMGDPRSVDIDASRRYRTEEYARLRGKYGAYQDDELWEQNRPKLTCRTLEGEPITTVVDDPFGKDLTAVSESVTQREFLEQQIAQMAETQRRMQSELELQKQQLAARLDADLSPEDLDHQITTSKSVAPEITPQPAAPIDKPRAKAKVTKDGPNSTPVDG